MFLMGKATKRKWIAATTAGLFWAVLNVSGYNYSLEIPVALVSGVIAAYAIGRLGCWLHSPCSLRFSYCRARHFPLILIAGTQIGESS